MPELQEGAGPEGETGYGPSIEGDMEVARDPSEERAEHHANGGGKETGREGGAADGSNYRVSDDPGTEIADGSNYRDDEAEDSEIADGSNYRVTDDPGSTIADGSNYRDEP